jgi:hypothetical protein
MLENSLAIESLQGLWPNACLIKSGEQYGVDSWSCFFYCNHLDGLTVYLKQCQVPKGEQHLNEKQSALQHP